MQAAIGSTALDLARNKQAKELEKYGMNVLTVAVLAILITAPIGALVIGLTGPILLQKPRDPASWNAHPEGESPGGQLLIRSRPLLGTTHSTEKTSLSCWCCFSYGQSTPLS